MIMECNGVAFFMCSDCGERRMAWVTNRIREKRLFFPFSLPCFFSHLPPPPPPVPEKPTVWYCTQVRSRLLLVKILLRSHCPMQTVLLRGVAQAACYAISPPLAKECVTTQYRGKRTNGKINSLSCVKQKIRLTDHQIRTHGIIFTNWKQTVQSYPF